MLKPCPSQFVQLTLPKHPPFEYAFTPFHEPMTTPHAGTPFIHG